MKEDIDKAISKMNKAIDNKEVIYPPQVLNSNKGVIKDKEVKQVGRPKLIDKAMEVKLVRLAEELFFIRSIAGEAGIDVKTIQRYLEDKENEDFVLSFMRGRDRWIASKQKQLETFSENRSTDWKAMKYLLTIADKEFSERKYLTEAVANQDAKILMLIKAEQLTIASKKGKEMLKTVINTPSQGEESISLLPFKPEDPKNKGKAKRQKNKG
ncbi:hypothetical protein KAX08_05560 [candidate division WOR-3 bacterium]|nr:hypothetical protein [candidate division WOR-3 bacterium]